MTKFLVGPSWVYLVVVIDWYTKKVVGWDLALRSKAADWLRALENAILSEFPQGVRDKGLKLISDNGFPFCCLASMRESSNKQFCRATF